MPWVKDWKSGDMEFHCPICDSAECEVLYYSDGECIGCDQCITHEYVCDIEDDEDYPDEDRNDLE